MFFFTNSSDESSPRRSSFNGTFGQGLGVVENIPGMLVLQSIFVTLMTALEMEGGIVYCLYAEMVERIASVAHIQNNLETIGTYRGFTCRHQRIRQRVFFPTRISQFTVRTIAESLYQNYVQAFTRRKRAIKLCTEK